MNFTPFDILYGAFWGLVHEAEYFLADLEEIVKSIPVSFGSWGDK